MLESWVLKCHGRAVDDVDAVEHIVSAVDACHAGCSSTDRVLLAYNMCEQGMKWRFLEAAMVVVSPRSWELRVALFLFCLYDHTRPASLDLGYQTELSACLKPDIPLMTRNRQSAAYRSASQGCHKLFLVDVSSKFDHKGWFWP